MINHTPFICLSIIYENSLIVNIFNIIIPHKPIFPYHHHYSFLILLPPHNNNHMNITSVHPYCSGFEPFLLFSDYIRRFKDGINIYKDFFWAASYLGAKVLILHGDSETLRFILEEGF